MYCCWKTSVKKEAAAKTGSVQTECVLELACAPQDARGRG